ncbi:hypothetical protein ACIQU6_05185 [Streptomyces sp. NPDC090442]|uniref:hypothetical protein n=1 Tax=Streptomyces sp. NPDC090442 TaxID=3365962 RepID=UPI0037FAEFA8
MKRLALALSTAAAAATLALGFAGSAYATDGTFFYTNGDEQLSLVNPQADTCFNVTGDGHAFNKTNKTALVFRRPGCIGTNFQKIDPSEHAYDIKFRSVEFVS